jgi:Tfp pilus assembly pilus retraction ATPase PilT
MIDTDDVRPPGQPNAQPELTPDDAPQRPHLASADRVGIGEEIVPAERVERFHASGEVDFAYSLPGVGRFRVNVFRQRGSVSAVLRKHRFGGPSFQEMGLPDVIRQLADEPRGLVLVRSAPTPRASCRRSGRPSVRTPT